jgi:hypothetical protein
MQKTIPISERLRVMQEMKNLQAKAKTITKLEMEKARMEQAHSESLQMMKENVTVRVMETLIEKNVQMKSKGDDLEKKFQDIEKSVQKEHMT